jgi:iron complex outermembrane receptor protein
MLAGASALLGTLPLETLAQADRAHRDGVAASLEEIVVTARKRDESSLDVPVAINVFTAADIEAAGIERPQDFIDLTPNMSLVQTQNQGTSFVTVRGISQARNSEPSVAVLIDGVLMANPSQFNQELVDIESIQVLKGPQGALYGRNAIGGAIIINTKEPTDTFESQLTLGYDSGPGYKARASFSGPLTSILKYRATVSYLDTDFATCRRGYASCWNHRTTSAPICASTYRRWTRRRSISISPRASTIRACRCASTMPASTSATCTAYP